MNRDFLPDYLSVAGVERPDLDWMVFSIWDFCQVGESRWFQIDFHTKLSLLELDALDGPIRSISNNLRLPQLCILQAITQIHKYTNARHKYKYTNYTFLNFAIGKPSTLVKLDSTTGLRFKRTVIVTHLTLFSRLSSALALAEVNQLGDCLGASFGLVTSLPSDKPSRMKSILPFVTRHWFTLASPPLYHLCCKSPSLPLR